MKVREIGLKMVSADFITKCTNIRKVFIDLLNKLSLLCGV